MSNTKAPGGAVARGGVFREVVHPSIPPIRHDSRLWAPPRRDRGSGRGPLYRLAPPHILGLSFSIAI